MVKQKRKLFHLKERKGKRVRRGGESNYERKIERWLERKRW